MADDNDARERQQPPEPGARLRSLDRLVGTWEVSGGLRGTVTFEWMEGGFFLIQNFDLDHAGRKIKGFEVIGHERSFWVGPSEDIKTRVYTTTGDTLDYTYEVAGDRLRIWFGERDSPAYFEGTFGEDGKTYFGAWHFPGGGGYEVSATRVEQTATKEVP